MDKITAYNDKKVIDIKMDNKPIIAEKSEYTKIKDYTVEDRNTLTYNLVIHLLSLLQVQTNLEDEKTESHLKMAKWINDAMGKFTYQEIIYAFDLAIAGEFKPLELIPGYLNAVVVGRVMSSYQTKKNTELTAYNQLKQKQLYKPKEKTEEEKQLDVIHGCVSVFDSYKQKGYIIDGYLWVHGHLMDLKLLKFSDEEKDIMWKEAKAKARAGTECYDTNIREIEYKKIRMARYFDALIAKGEHLKDKI